MSIRTFASAGLLLAFVIGCGGDTGPKTYAVSGSVMLDGAPVEVADLRIVPADGKGTSAGAKVEKGKFSLQTTPGKKTVEITAMRDVPGKFREDNPGEKTPVREQYIPKKYNEKSTLELDVSEKDNKDVTFDLKSK